MAHLLTPAPTTTPTALSAKSRKSGGCFPTPTLCCIGSRYQHQASSFSNQDPCHHQSLPHSRRALMGLSGALAMGLSLSDEHTRANAAGRRPPPPPPKEKQDPNLSGVQAKVLASKKRKEAMKEEVARLRERGKPVNKEPPPPPPPPPPAPAPE